MNEELKNSQIEHDIHVAQIFNNEEIRMLEAWQQFKLGGSTDFPEEKFSKTNFTFDLESKCDHKKSMKLKVNQRLSFQNQYENKSLTEAQSTDGPAIRESPESSMLEIIEALKKMKKDKPIKQLQKLR